jgi:hypothetical protein
MPERSLATATPAAPPAAAARRGRAEPGVLLALYAVLFAAWDLAGGTFRVYPDLWQLLPWPPLLEDLGGSLLDLHAQPPLLNLLFGAALRLGVATGWPLERILEPIYFLAGAATVLVTWVVAARLVPRRGVRIAVLLVLLLNPYFYAVHHYLFYTAWELLLLSLVALLGIRYLAVPTPGRLAAVLGVATVLVYARSAFHPLWFAATAAALVALASGHARAARTRHLVVAALALALALAWPLKNLARFGVFGFSSWSGVSLARGLPTGEPLLPSGYPQRLAAFARASTEPPDPRAVVEAQRLVPPELASRPTLAAVTKPDGSPNWNHYALVPLSRAVGDAALERLRDDPGLLLYKAVDFYLNGYAVYEARWPYTAEFSPELTVGDAWARAYELLVFQRFRPYDGRRTAATTGFALLFPLVVGGALLLLWRRRPWAVEERAIALLLGTILWILALVVLVDGPEGNRVRFCTEPYLLLVAGWAVCAVRSARARS